MGFFAITDCTKVGIKYFTTLKTATLGFGLSILYECWILTAELADFFRKNYSDGVDLWGYTQQHTKRLYSLIPH